MQLCHGEAMDETIAIVQEEGILDMVANSGPVVTAVLIILVLLSLWSWTITIAKLLQFRKAKKETEAFSQIFWESRNLSQIDGATRRLLSTPLSHVFNSGYKTLGDLIKEREEREEREAGSARFGEIDILQMSLNRAEIEEGVRLEKGVTFLATVASAAPFIGLFGTVWGIMDAFLGLGKGGVATTLEAVAPGISEALIATAIGLAAAIPAAIAYNFFVVEVKNFKDLMTSFSSEFISIAARFFV
jgi:biopolymer transport protein TolQ